MQRRKLRKEAGEGGVPEGAIDDAPDPRLDLHAMTEEHVSYGHRLEPHIADTSRLCWEELDAGHTVIFEGAQATLLDLDHGTYPFVTSSNPIAGAATVGAGVGPLDIDEVWGVAKAYATRVGAGPFPTELDDATGRHMLEKGHEYGTTTGRERRCGWMDLVALRYAVRLNRMTSLAITKLDVLSGLETLRVAVRYRSREGALLDSFPYHQSILHGATPEYEELPGSRPTWRGAAARTTCRARRATTWRASPSSPGCRSAWSASARVGTRSSGSAPPAQPIALPESAATFQVPSSLRSGIA